MKSFELPILYRKKANKIYFWQILVTNNDEEVNIVTKHGIYKGKVKTSIRKITKTGRSDTLYEKGQKDSTKKWNDKIKKEGYVDSLEKESKLFVTPMLAKTVTIKNNNIKGLKFPLMVQPKLDGFRCTANFINEIELMSRNNLPYKGLKTLKKELIKLYDKLDKNIWLDGELYIPDIPFEIFSGYTKRAQGNEDYDIENIEFRVFDCFNLDDMKMKFSDRNKLLKSLISNSSLKIKYVKTEIVNNLEEFKKYFSIFIEEGYEGIMVRTPSSPYEISKRSSHLQKYKEFEDDEFEITGFMEAKGSDSGSVIWICKTKDSPTSPGKEFNVRPVGSLEHRRELFKNAESNIGKLLTVKYQELSEKSNIPRFPVGKTIREIDQS